jgi:SAM-dependent methyltransferase
MTVFAHYARYYDLLYKDKDYTGEAEYVHALLQRQGNTPKSILELGCGTGKHALLLAKKGYAVTGVDMSEEMLAAARERKVKDGKSLSLEFTHGDVRSVRVDKKFDAVISLFHVMSYQTTNEDLSNAFQTAAAHLKRGGIFVFDCWYGPAVLTDRPTVRVKRLEDDIIQVTRLAEPDMHPNENIVDVNYTLFIRDKASGKVEEVKETHRMRHLFAPEISSLIGLAGFKVLHSEEWMTGKVPGFDTWGVVFVGKVGGLR